MAYELSWVIPSRVLLVEIENVLPTDETIRLIDECHACVSSGQAPVHILIDATKIVNAPINLQELTQLSKSMQNQDIGWWVLINPAKMIWFTASVVSKLLQKKLKSAHSIQEALRILERVDLTLDTQITLPVAM